MTCEECTAAREVTEHRRFDIRCIHCGARYYQLLKTWPLPREIADDTPAGAHTETLEERAAWRTKVLDDWVAWGHDRKAFLALAGAAKVPFAPVQQDVIEAAPVVAQKRKKR